MECFEISNSKPVSFLFLASSYTALCALLSKLKAQGQLISPESNNVSPEFRPFFVVNDSRAKKSILLLL